EEALSLTGLFLKSGPIVQTNFFFRAKSGIRDYKVTGVRRVLFRSDGAPSRGASPPRWSAVSVPRARWAGWERPGSSKEPSSFWRSEGRRVGQECTADSSRRKDVEMVRDEIKLKDQEARADIIIKQD